MYYDYEENGKTMMVYAYVLFFFMFSVPNTHDIYLYCGLSIVKKLVIQL